MSSIYHKQCPSCAAQNPADADRCACGHTFTAGTDGVTAGSQEAVGESQLLVDYLAARVDQALADVESARTELAADPRNFKKAARVLRAAQEARALGDELNAQREYTTSLCQSLGIDNPTTPPVEPVQTERAGERFTAQQAAKARQITAQFEGTETKSCPQCGTVLPVSSLLCFCSHRFPLIPEQVASTRDSPAPLHPKSLS